MIEIPERVQDALRDGRYLKNYRFKVIGGGNPRNEWVTVFSHDTVTEDDEYWYTVPKTDNYKFVSATGTASNYWGYFLYTDGTQSPDMYTANAGDVVAFEEGTILQFVISHGSLRLQTYDTSRPDITIDNDNLVKETVNFDERMCSDETIKFGLCEGTSLEFQYFEYPNITGCRIQALLDVQYKDADKTLKWYQDIPMGWFDADECSYQMATGIRKCKAYNKLKSEYLDQKANELIYQEFYFLDYVYLLDILNFLLNGYHIDQKEYEAIKPDIWIDGGYSPTDAKTYFTPFKYMMLDGDQGPFSPAVMRSDVTTSTNIYMSGTAHVKKYIQSSLMPYYDLPIQIKSTVDLEAIDKAVSEWIQINVRSDLLYTNAYVSEQTKDEIWKRIKSMRGSYIDYSFNRPIVAGYFFYIEVICGDTTQGPVVQDLKVYQFGNTFFARDADVIYGSFEQLKHTTFTHVLAVNIITPYSIKFGKTTESIPGGNVKDSYVMVDPQSSRVASNEVYLFGDNRIYAYKNTNNTYSFKDYSGAKYLDGTLIPDTFYNDIAVYAVYGVSDAELIKIDPREMADVTLRELQSAAFETVCQFGKLDRETDLFAGVELNKEHLYPAEDLYPREDLYPAGGQEGSFRSQYSKLWFDEGDKDTWRYLIITYKGTEEDEQGNVQEKDFTLQRTVNTNGTVDYNMSDNWLFRNLIWTAEQVGEYADKMVAKMRGITWFPFEMWCAGLPYIETGDEIEIIAHDKTHISYVLQRQLKGIQNLQDTFINGQLDIF